MSAPPEVVHVELDVHREPGSHDAFVLLDAFEEYASRQRWEAEDAEEGHARFLNELAEVAERFRARIEATLYP